MSLNTLRTILFQVCVWLSMHTSEQSEAPTAHRCKLEVPGDELYSVCSHLKELLELFEAIYRILWVQARHHGPVRLPVMPVHRAAPNRLSYFDIGFGYVYSGTDTGRQVVQKKTVTVSRAARKWENNLLT